MSFDVEGFKNLMEKQKHRVEIDMWKGFVIISFSLGFLLGILIVR